MGLANTRATGACCGTRQVLAQARHGSVAVGNLISDPYGGRNVAVQIRGRPRFNSSSLLVCTTLLCMPTFPSDTFLPAVLEMEPSYSLRKKLHSKVRRVPRSCAAAPLTNQRKAQTGLNQDSLQARSFKAHNVVQNMQQLQFHLILRLAALGGCRVRFPKPGLSSSLARSGMSASRTVTATPWWVHARRLAFPLTATAIQPSPARCQRANCAVLITAA